MKSARLISFAVASLATACSPPANEAKRSEMTKVARVSGPEESYVSTSIRSGAYPWTEVVRCWKRDGQFDCLRVFSFPFDRFTPDARVSVQRGVFDAPPTEWPEDRGGYSCSFEVGSGLKLREEMISRGNSAIASKRSISSNRQRWTPEEVRIYMRGNKIAGCYFDCHRLADLIEEGGLDAINSNKITYAGIMSR